MDFKEYLMEQKLADTTIKAHIRNLDKFGELPINIIERIEECVNTTPQRLAVACTVSKFLKFKELPNKEVVDYIKVLTDKFQEEKDAKMAEMTLPTIKEIKDHMKNLYDKADFRSYVILYLMTQFQVRNMDMIANVVGSKRDTNKTDNWFVSTPSQVTWIRNKYKTSSVYGTKTHIIKNKQFMNAIQQLEYVLKPSDNVDRVIKKATSEIGYITEGTIAKIVLAENNNMNSIKKVSKNRGTSTDKLINSYNIT
jgi:hypothetical protein